MSSPAVTERVRRLEEVGIIRGYRAIVDPARIGRPIGAIIRVRMGMGRNYGEFDEQLRARPEVVE